MKRTFFFCVLLFLTMVGFSPPDLEAKTNFLEESIQFVSQAQSSNGLVIFAFEIPGSYNCQTASLANSFQSILDAHLEDDLPSVFVSINFIIKTTNARCLFQNDFLRPQPNYCYSKVFTQEHFTQFRSYQWPAGNSMAFS